MKLLLNWNQNKIGISSSWLEELIETESDGFQEALFQIDPKNFTLNKIENVPEVTTGSFCLDYASIEDNRCQILTGISKENFFMQI
ncbi:hypothetical protein BpHYR1_034726 [Brachionus plicatilis]|uniref:Uncharacterized protein n=1 Tax=Brachionus plicatilis TaxID=10195 RepID=A0A3M7R329_BRAPC|nr:hypothetical protein BpHYR1_034726 [Brachionus plicatilis]